MAHGESSCFGYPFALLCSLTACSLAAGVVCVQGADGHPTSDDGEETDEHHIGRLADRRSGQVVSGVRHETR